MSDALPLIYLARHGETAWTLTGQHTGATDLPLTAQGEAEAVRLGERLAGSPFAAVLTSPLQRAVRTCELAGFRSAAEIEPDLVEKYEHEGSPYYSTARIWDDGILDPIETRRALALGLSAAYNAPILDAKFGVFRM